MNQQQLLDFLGPDLSSIPNIFDFAVEIRLSIGPGENARANWLLESSLYLAWFYSLRSKLLVIKDHEASQTKTPLSMVSAILLTGLRGISNCLSIYYFCGGIQNVEETANTEATGNRPHSLLRGLIRQILAQVPCKTGFLTLEMIHKIDENDLNYLWRVFETLVRSLGEMVIWCVIDGFSSYPDKAEVFFVIQKYQQLKEDRNVRFKLLLTDPVPSEIDEYVSQEEIMEVPIDAWSDGKGLRTRMRMAQTFLSRR